MYGDRLTRHGNTKLALTKHVNEHREETTNMHLRLPKSLRRYAVQAAKRDGYDNQSEYVRALIATDARRHNVKPTTV